MDNPSGNGRSSRFNFRRIAFLASAFFIVPCLPFFLMIGSLLVYPLFTGRSRERVLVAFAPYVLHPGLYVLNPRFLWVWGEFATVCFILGWGLPCRKQSGTRGGEEEETGHQEPGDG